MPNVLTTASNVNCGHPLAATQLPGAVNTVSTAKLRVDGRPVLVKSGILLKTISKCGITGPNSTPCSLVSGVTTGESLKLRAGGQPVMLDTLKGTTDGKLQGDVPPTPQPKLAATAGQAKLQAP